MWWLILLAPLLILLTLAWIPLRFCAALNIDDHRITLQAGVNWAWWRLWHWPSSTASKKAHFASPQGGEGKSPARSMGRERKSGSGGFSWPLDFEQSWQLVQKYWRPLLKLFHFRFAGNLQLQLENAALTGWLFAAAGASGWPPPSLRLQLEFGQVDRLVGDVSLALRVYPAEVIGLLLRLLVEPPIRRSIWEKIRKKGDRRVGRSKAFRGTAGESDFQQDGDR